MTNDSNANEETLTPRVQAIVIQLLAHGQRCANCVQNSAYSRYIGPSDRNELLMLYSKWLAAAKEMQDLIQSE